VLTVAVLLIFPLAWIRVGGLHGFIAGSPKGFFAITSGPYDFKYLLAFALIAAMSYNGTWSIVQKFYCVKREKDARKVAMLAAGLNLVGPMLFLIPPMMARQILPGLATPPGSPQYAYAELGLYLLPAGMMGILIAAMLAAAMGALSADYNALSSVVTNDIYCRMFKPGVSSRHLRTVGMLATLVGGGLAIGVSLLVLASGTTGLFNKMVVLFGLALGPTVLPMLGGLFVRKLSARGALAGFIAGFASGIGLYLYRTLVLEKQSGMSKESLTYSFITYSTFINIGVTVLAMFLVTTIEKRSRLEEEKVRLFFDELDTPVEQKAEAQSQIPSPFFIIGVILVGLGFVLFLAGCFSPSESGRHLDWLVAAGLALFGALLYKFHRRSFAAALVK
jgi:SSS family solute:Na+ symporter